MNLSTLPELDRRRTQMTIENMLERYRIFKTVTFEAKEAGSTYSNTEKFHGPTHRTTDQTAPIAAHNVDVPAARRAYCTALESVVDRLEPREQQLVHERYMRRDGVYDYTIYNHVFDPPVSKDTYVKIRSKAFYKMALALADLELLSLGALLKCGTAVNSGQAESIE
ncbi:ArpU family phage packaging/lysis transcriptional regulator [Paenibacillus sp. FSL R7-0331]|uniref:ArpU family phage packaging/lysis transcriptional regulator n=1 Tax=Paenibacillus sp. FSL R7-0331 TaxID=1536773 RepID=UPI0004F74C7D|nr:ArpU family phage packaging/lysis transcriptional regulator [Paenibacillus sp. FSL R7-0331]AIQ54986.1 transcriptional regulator [Paenibacillus sp. FSL R7-0331]